MKNSVLVFLTLIIAGFSLAAQKPNPVTWDFKLEQVNNKDYKLIATASIAPSWVLYSQFTGSDGPVPTSFMVNGKDVQLKEESKVISEMDKIFEMEVKHFKHSAVFTKIIQKGNEASVKGSVEFMTCDGLKCLPPATIPFDLKF
ncbi:MAG: hypothetical protein LC107_05935 [Chitinophagales bacterium]|nr:hypothetical protein [Chitinophagales bacterium]